MFEYWTEKIRITIQPFHLAVSVYVTKVSEGPDVFTDLPGFNIVYGERPNIGVQMDKIKTDNTGRRVWAHTCGSVAFTRDVINEGISRHFHVHNETSEF